MNVEKIAAIYELKDQDVKKILKTAGFDSKMTELSRDEMLVFDEVWTLVIKEGKTHKEAGDIMKQRAEQKSQPLKTHSATIDPKIMATIERQSEVMAEQIAGETPEIFLAQKEMIQQMMIERFWKRFAEIAESGELQRNFERVLGSNNPAVIEATVLPGESSALPESSTSAT